MLGDSIASLPWLPMYYQRWSSVTISTMFGHCWASPTVTAAKSITSPGRLCASQSPRAYESISNRPGRVHAKYRTSMAIAAW